MSNSRITLTEFIDSIPTCRQTANLSTVLALFKSSSWIAIAVLNEEEYPVGIIESQSLLSVLSKYWVNSPTVEQGSSLVQNQVEQSRNSVFPSVNRLSEKESGNSGESLESIFDLNFLIKPSVTLPSEIDREKLLSCIQSENISYLVVDSQKKFLGLLNSQKLMTSLILDSFNFKAETLSSSALEEFYFKSIEQIPLPLTIQTQQGKILYRNQTWREQINLAQELDCYYQKINPLSLLDRYCQQTPRQQEIENISLAPHCLKSNSHLLAESPSSLLLTKEFQLWELMGEVNSQIDFANYVKNLNNYLTSEQRWQYYRLPLDRSESSYWLVLAIKSPSEKKYDNSQQQSQATQSVQLNQFKDEFLGHISHELKSPLTAIVGLSSLLKEQKLGELNQRQTRYAELIYRGGRKLINIVNDLLDLTHIITNKVPLNLEPIKIKTICEEVYQQLINKLKTIDTAESNSTVYPPLKFEIELETVVADKSRLNQILSRLLKASLSSTRTPGEIGIAVRNGEKWLSITVWHQEKNTTDNYQSFFWETPLQSRENLANNQKSRELDLILAQEIAQSHGGELSFLSKVNYGSEFTLLIPNYRNNLNLSLEPNSVEFLPGRNLLILVAETNPNQINDIAGQLINFGYYPVIARTGTEALDKARQLQPSKILLSPSLPVLSSEDLITLLKADSRTQKTPIFMTTNAQSGLDKSKYKLVDGWLDLPLAKSALLEIVSPIKTESVTKKKRLTILSLHPKFEVNDRSIIAANRELDFALKARLDSLDHRVIEADCLEQGELLARIWQIDAILLDGSLLDRPLNFLRSLCHSEILASLPLVTLDAKTTAAAHQIEGLSVFPCLVPVEERTITDLAEVIQIATGFN
jgi:signal transduction histidine kinase/DNA-binding response OmpR family regulator